MERDPPPGIICHPVDDADMTHLEAYIKGPPDSPYEKGTFRLDIHIPSEYPFSPPTIRFKTMIYHPNVDDSGTICLNILKKSENDGWKPSLNIEASLKSIQVLMGEPNPNDPLDPEIAKEFQFDNALFIRKAKEFAQKYATGDQTHIDTVVRNPTTREKDDSTNQSQHDIPTTEKVNRSSERKSKLSLSTKKRKVRTSSSSSNDHNTTTLDSKTDNTTSTITTVNIQTNTQTSDRTLLSLSMSQHPPDEIQSNGSHVQSSTPSSSNSSQKMDTEKFITNVDDDNDDVDKDQALVIINDEKMDNDDNSNQWVMNDKKEMYIYDGEEVIALNESNDSQVLESLHSSLPQSQRNKEQSLPSPSNNIKYSAISKGDTRTEQYSNIKSQTDVEIEYPSYSQQKPLLSLSSSSLSEEKDKGADPTISKIIVDEENGIAIQDIGDVMEKETDQHDYPESKPSPNKDLDGFMIANAITARKPLQDSQSSRSVLDNDPLPPRDKGKGKAICKSPSPSSYNSSSFGEHYHQIFSATDDENYMPKKRTISASMRNKLSLSRSKRQK
ncbi:hypothetical protein INT45_007173 [Circinella minor]|uniref:UBC core domain-containing protein n=1 Tax=Circinella minor TaxID=1195481 RepID=A0A8H7VGJ1_9FUNG|nr:hypothetical protein INT45_007173 [Circinella minor]